MLQCLVCLFLTRDERVSNCLYFWAIKTKLAINVAFLVLQRKIDFFRFRVVTGGMITGQISNIFSRKFYVLAVLSHLPAHNLDCDTSL